MSSSHWRPSEPTLRWVEGALPGRARVVAWRRMTGGMGSVVHRLTVDRGSRREMLVLRRYERADGETAQLLRTEVATLDAVEDKGIPAPRLIAVREGNEAVDPHPAILMTRVPGRLDLTPADPESWLRQIAAMAARIHEVKVAAGPFLARADATAPIPPASAARSDVWEAAFEILRQEAPQLEDCFLHRDYQHFNLLWQRGRLTGVVDWTMSCAGPAAFDIGHCRLNLTILFGPDWAERLREAYEAEVGRVVDPWWDLYAVTAYNDEWRRFIPKQVAGRRPVDDPGMTERVEHLIEAILHRA